MQETINAIPTHVEVYEMHMCTGARREARGGGGQARGGARGAGGLGTGGPRAAGRDTPGEPWESAARGDGVRPTVSHPDEGEYDIHYVKKKE